MRTAFLWLHVISGVIWIGTSAVTTVAANALTFNTDEFREFVSKAIPTIDRVNICAALALLITGLVNFLLLATPVAFDLPSMFVVVLGLKVILFAAMAVALVAIFRGETQLKSAARSEAAGWGAAKMIRIGILSGLTAVLGAIALTLGVWLAGTL